jgi:hypothetical protein
MRRSGVIRLGVLVSTVALAWGALAVGTQDPSVGPQVGKQATRLYVAQRSESVVDEEATAAAREEVAAAVAPVTVKDEQLEASVFESLDAALAAVREATIPATVAPTLIPDPTSTTTTSTTLAVEGGEPAAEETLEAELEPALLSGQVFVDVDGDAVFDATVEADAWRADFGLNDVRVVAVTEDGTQSEAVTASDGSYEMEVAAGPIEVIVDAETVPDGYESAGEIGFSQTADCSGETCTAGSLGLAPALAPLEERVEGLRQVLPTYSPDTIATLTEFAAQDLVRTVTGDQLTLDLVEAAALERLTQLFASGIQPGTEVQEVKNQARLDRQIVLIDNRRNEAAREAVNELVSQVVAANYVTDQEATEAERQAAMALVDPETVDFREGDVIAEQGETLTELMVSAIEQTGADFERTVRQAALGAVLVILVATLAYYLARFRRTLWERPRMVALLGMLIVLGAGAVRLTILFQESSSWYVLPAVAFGYLAAVLLDNRMGTLMALAMGVLGLVGTGEPGVGVYAALATLAPIGFVSSVSSRRAFRNSVVFSAIGAGIIAAASSWFFDTNLTDDPFTRIWMDAAWAGGVALFASLVALAAMPFFEAMFDITTTLRLLELTDRNHEALQLIQEKAFGTFNHSLMVGTLADTAAKAIGADNLLARAAAYFHDIGKTENPTYFIENQFGTTNPHDDLPPEESAQLIRNHVLDGMDLARRHNIPSEVSEGILAHHGDGIMRYFYEKARSMYGEEAVNPDLYRHAGHKPRSREMAILMVADAVEGACRAVFSEEEPTPDSISKVVNRVIDEKVGDGQLSACDLTLGELTEVRRAFIESMVGHYHQRIPYPNFPGS